MKVSVAQLNNGQLSNTKTLKYRNSGIKSVSVKNTPFASPKIKSNQSLRVNEDFNQKSFNNTVKLQSGLQKQSQLKSELVLSLLEKCLRPQIPNLKHNSYETDEINSRVIFMINKTQTQNLIDQTRPKSCGIKIGSKAQKHRQNNKSEPKKVYDLSNLSSKYENSPSQNKKQQSPAQGQNRKLTERKINTKILMTKKNSPQITQFSSRLKKFQQDLKKTKKPKILTLDFHSTNNNINAQQNEHKNYMSLKNHPILQKFQPVSCPDIYVSPQFQQKRNQIEMDDIETINKEYFPRDKFHNKESLQNLQKTKKIINFVFQNNQNIDSKILDNRQTKSSKQINKEIFNIDSLLSKEEIQYVLERFKKNQSKAQEIISESRIDPTLQLLNISIPEVSCENSQDKYSPSHKDQEEFSLLKQMKSVNLNYRQSQALRVTDYNKKVRPLHKVESPVSQRRRSVNNFKPRQSFQQSKIRCLNEGAKTIVTKYDSSDKRSIVQESVILFQCSKDLKPSFSRQLLNLNEYATRYRGSLGVQSLINQNQDQYLMGNSKMEGRFYDESQNTFEKLLISPNPNNGKLRKSYSIKEIQNNNF